MDDRKQLRLYVSSAAKESVERFALQYDMTETGVASRIFEWFGTQPIAAQKWITGLVDGTERADIERFRAEFGEPPSHGARPHVGSSMTFKSAAKELPRKK